MDTEAGWIGEARKGSAEAFSRLVRRHQAALRSYLALYVRARDAADDLAQESFLAAFRSLPSYKGESSFRVWLLGIARHRALGFLRDEQRRLERMQDTLDVAVSSWKLGRAEAEGVDADRLQARIDALQGCLKELPPDGAGLLREIYFRGRSAVEVARNSGRRENAVWMALTRLRQALRDCVRGKLAGQEAGA